MAPTSVPTQAPANPTEAETGGVLFSLDFSDTSEYIFEPTAESTYSYVDGRYQIDVLAPEWDSWVTFAGPYLQDLAVEVWVQDVSGATDAYGGIVCGYVEGEEHNDLYVLLVNGYGAARIAQWKGGEYKTLTSQTSVPGLSPSGNQVQAVCAKNYLGLYANGSLLLEHYPAEPVSGKVGIIASSFDTPNIRVQFDDFVVTGLGAGTFEPDETPIAAPTQISEDPDLLFFDDFSDETAHYTGKDGAYRIELTAIDYDWHMNFTPEYNEGVIVEVDAWEASGAANGLVGIICASKLDTPSAAYYAMSVSASKAAEIFYWKNNTFYRLTRAYHLDSVKPGVNHLMGVCVGRHLALYVNGELAVEGDVTDNLVGAAGVVVTSFDTGYVDGRFDNFTVRSADSWEGD